jgi:hypothetical protein
MFMGLFAQQLWNFSHDEQINGFGFTANPHLAPWHFCCDHFAGRKVKVFDRVQKRKEEM